jgi:hypothetical protein
VHVFSDFFVHKYAKTIFLYVNIRKFAVGCKVLKAKRKEWKLLFEKERKKWKIAI